MRRGTASDGRQDCDGQLRRQATFAFGDRVKCTALLCCRDTEGTTPTPENTLVQPAEANTPDDADSDPNRVVYFSQAGRLYRVARPFFCADARACTFRELNAAEVAEPVFGNCEPGTTNCQTSIYSDGRLEHTRRDPSLTAMSGRLWPQNMGVRLRDVPPSGLTFSTDEYNRHKAIYFAIMKLRQFGPNYIEDGILDAHVRVCLIAEGGDPATCEGTRRNVFVQQPQQAAVTRAKEEIRTRVVSAPSRANLPALNPDPLDRVFPMECVGEWRPYLSSSSRLLASSDRAFCFSGH
jgi:hypothetical protein